MSQISPELEMSRPLDVSDLPAHGQHMNLEATPAECEALCRRFGLEALCDLSARLLVERARTTDGVRAIRVHGSFSAQVEQVCVLTLDSFAVQIADQFDIYFVPSSEELDDESDSIDTLSEETLEPLATPEIDLGELVAQHLALTLDPHPRRPGAIAQPGKAVADEANVAHKADNPFAVLGQLKHKM